MLFYRFGGDVLSVVAFLGHKGVSFHCVSWCCAIQEALQATFSGLVIVISLVGL